MQLVAYGAQDIYLTGNPQITFWKVVYRRYTNFAMESIEQVFNGQADFGKKVQATVNRSGDLIYRVYLQATLPEVQCPCSESKCFRWVNYIGHALIKSVEVEIGGQRIDKHYGDWLNIWNELTQEPGHQVGYDNMVGNTIFLTGTALSHTEATTLYIPLQFWFCRNPGLALPLIALQYHEVRISLDFRNKEECYIARTSSGCSGGCGNGGSCDPGTCDVCVGSLEYASLWIDYIYLDTDERRRFAQVSHEYLIEQLQFTGDESTTNVNVKVKLNFNHPVKELIWVVQREDFCCRGINQWTNYTDDFDNDCCEYAPGCAPTEPCTICGGLQGVCLINANVDNSYGGRTAFPQGPGLHGVNRKGPISPVCLSCYERCDGTSEPSGPGCDGCGPVNFGSINIGFGGGADHAGLAPLNAGRNPTVRAKLQLNGHDRFTERLGSYFNLVQPYQHHTNIPATGINVYSFALKPEEHQPSGTCNFSRIDNACLQLQLTPKAVKSAGARIRVYATNYNVLRIMSGMGGIAFSN